MEVTSSTPIAGQAGHVIEIGQATWDETEMSVRNRYPTRTGGFSPRSSSEIPLHDIREIVRVVADQDVFSLADASAMIAALTESIRRRV